MVDRLIPYKGYSYERDLIEYGGAVVNDPTNTPLPIAVYASPGISVVRNSAGNYSVNIIDKMPIFNQILTTEPPAPNLSCIDLGYGSSMMIWTSLWPELQAPGTVTQIGASQGILYAQNSVGFQVITYVAGVAADMSFSFRIWITGQPAKFVQGLGA
jgi:hypothetical protein